MQSDRRLYVTADGAQVVEEGDPDGAFLLVGAGSEIHGDVAEKHKLRISKGKVSYPASEARAKEAKAAEKAEKAEAAKEAKAAEAKAKKAKAEADAQGAEDSATE